LKTDLCKFESSQKDEAEPGRLMPQKLVANLVFLIAVELHLRRNRGVP